MCYCIFKSLTLNNILSNFGKSKHSLSCRGDTCEISVAFLSGNKSEKQEAKAKVWRKKTETLSYQLY